MKRFLMIFFVMLQATFSFGQELDVFTEVVDFFTHEGLDTAEVALLNAADSCLVDSGKCYVWNWDESNYCLASAKIKKPGNYLLKITSFGYEPKYVPLNIDKLYKREKRRNLKRTSLQKASKVTERILDGVVVQATKIKFFMDGDTLTYNADAFDLAEGSMLDALIKKLPGVELKDGGEITVNGKKVDALLLNGKNFFNSDRELILENLPAYMVKKVQSYERVPERYEGTARAKTEKKEVVLNVKLKKEYNQGWIANVRGGVGLPVYKEEGQDDALRYLGRLFALHFTDISRLSFYANVNNLSDNRQPGEDENWTPQQQPQGVLTTYNFGVDGNIDKELDHTEIEYTGDARFDFTKSENDSYLNTQSFLETGDTYGKVFSQSLNKDFRFNTNHDLRIHNHGEQKHVQNYWFSFSPGVSYHEWKRNGESGIAALSDNVANQWGKAWIDSICNPQAGEILRKYGINRTLNETKGDGHQTDVRVNTYAGLSPKHDDGTDIDFQANYNYSDNLNSDYEHYYLDYPRDPTAAVDTRNRYNPSTTLSHNASAGISCSRAFDSELEHSVHIGYNFTYDYNRSNQPLYLLHKLEGWGTDSVTHQFQHPLGDLPSVDELMSTIDTDNSSWKTTQNIRHEPELSYRWGHQDTIKSTFTLVQVGCRLPINNEKLDYQKGVVDTLIVRNTVLPAPSIFFFQSNYKKGSGWHAGYNFNINPPSLTSMVDVKDDRNPLYITRGNPNLKDAYQHSFNVNYNDKWNRVLFNAGINANITQNQMAMGFIYNTVTGVRTVTPENVNGNWNASVNCGVDVPFLKDDKLRFNNNASFNYVNSVDLNGTESTQVATRSEVRSQYVNESIGLTWNPSKTFEGKIKGDFHYQYSNSDRENFTVQNVFDFDYGIIGKVELPWDFQFATDLTMYSRRGYSEKTMNTNELVWNARLSKRLLHGNLVLQLDGFDILGKLSNTRKSINAQGKTETFYNVVPSYVLFHAVWKLNKRPKG